MTVVKVYRYMSHRKLYNRASYFLSKAKQESCAAVKVLNPVGCAPTALIIGAQKGGTTSLQRNLQDHPEILTSYAKEVHFFDKYYNRGYGWYLKNFPKGAKHSQIVEATPNYLFCTYVPERVFSCLPSAKFIVLLRNPIDRAYSHFQMAVRRGAIERTSSEFLMAIQEELQYLVANPISRHNFDHVFDSWARRKLFIEDRRGVAGRVPGAYTYNFDGFLLRGIYVESLRKWFSYFPREQFLILASEEYFADPVKVISVKVLPFLGVSNKTLGMYRSTERAKDYVPLASGVRNELRELFQPYNSALQELIQQDLAWA